MVEEPAALLEDLIGVGIKRLKRRLHAGLAAHQLLDPPRERARDPLPLGDLGGRADPLQLREEGARAGAPASAGSRQAAVRAGRLPLSW